MAVAKSFQKYPIVGEPYEKNKRYYILIKYTDGHTREVRWYTDAEYAKMYPEEKKSAEMGIFGKKIGLYRDILGFKQGYITIFKGPTDQFEDWFRENGATYRTFWGWAFETDHPVPEIIPTGLEPKQLKWEDVAYIDKDELRPRSEIEAAIAELVYEESPSQFQGAVGDRIDRTLTVTRIIPIDNGRYGPSTFYLFSDELGNVYSWTTAAKQLEMGETYFIRGTVKEHRNYHRICQTVLTRCSVDKPV